MCVQKREDMSTLIKTLISLGFCYLLVDWAVSNPDSATSALETVGNAFTATTDFISEKLFDKQGE
jgi:hypothetical protein|tara:strand:- start:614 stop:808 length:195 start_codon:yes stop_codon:yes gene_type:complete